MESETGAPVLPVEGKNQDTGVAAPGAHSNMTAANDNSNGYEDPWSGMSQAAEAVGREDAVSSIFEIGMAFRKAACKGQGTEAARKAYGALCIWRAAYAAAYREMLAIEDQLNAYAAGAGIMSEIPEPPKEAERRGNVTAVRAANACQTADELGDDSLSF